MIERLALQKWPELWFEGVPRLQLKTFANFANFGGLSLPNGSHRALSLIKTQRNLQVSSSDSLIILNTCSSQAVKWNLSFVMS